MMDINRTWKKVSENKSFSHAEPRLLLAETAQQWLEELFKIIR
jgi:hypothetical protein